MNRIVCLASLFWAFAGIAPAADANYRALRDSQPEHTFAVKGLTIRRDAGVFHLLSGHLSFIPAVLDRRTVAVFTGDGEFKLTPLIPIEARYLHSITGKETVAEPFDRAVFCFTDGTFEEIKDRLTSAPLDARARDVLVDFRNRVRRRTENPKGFVEALLATDDIVNIDAEILADLYRGPAAGSFRAFIFGRKHSDLRFIVHPDGALPQTLPPEEVALLNNAGNDEDGIWYLSHFEQEWKAGTASSAEQKSVIDVEHYRIDTTVQGEKLVATAELTFKAMRGGDRVLSFGLLPALRVSRASIGGTNVEFIQEDKKAHGAFYVIFPEPLVKDRSYKIQIEYQGDKVLEKAGGGNFSVRARTSWYPSVNAFNDRAAFDLTFKVPKRYAVVSVGKLVSEQTEKDWKTSRWTSEFPLAVAGFNIGEFKKKEVTDEATRYVFEGFANSSVPDYLRDPSGDGPSAMSPTRLTEQALSQSQAAMRIFSKWFGELPYGRLAITQQAEFSFGQSWPTLIYLPVSAFLDSTQRWLLMGQSSFKFAEFIQEVTPHEVAHQWWGHIVGWASYRDQWLSEGFADFSAGIYLTQTERSPERFLRYLDRSREVILNKNQYGRRANDAGPVWLGLRLNTEKNPGAYGRLVYPKGGFILHMLRMMMFQQETGNDRFIAMMHDFVKSHYNQNATTESFKAVVEKHMLPSMDLDGNQRMDWFFKQWVYGTELPSYRLEYNLSNADGGKVLLAGKVTQSGVSQSFRTPVQVYVEWEGGGLQRLGQLALFGSSTSDEFKVILPKRPRRVAVNAFHDVLAIENVNAQK